MLKSMQYCGIYIDDFYIQTTLISGSNTKCTNFEFSYSGIKELESYVMNLEKTIFVLFSVKLRRLYSFLYSLKKNIFINNLNKAFILNTALRNKFIIDYTSNLNISISQFLSVLASSQYIENSYNVRIINKDLIDSIPLYFTSYEEGYNIFLSKLVSEENNLCERELDIIFNRYKMTNTLITKNVTVDIFGICVSNMIARELPSWIKIKNSIMLTGIMEAITPSFELKESNILQTYCNKPKQSVLDKFNKLSFNRLLDSHGDYFIFDIAMEEILFSYWEYEKKYVAIHFETYNTKFSEFPPVNQIAPIDIPIQLFIEYLDKFIDKILDKYTPENIILIRMNWCNFLLTSEYPVYFSTPRHPEMTGRIEIYHRHILERIPQMLVIDIRDGFLPRTYTEASVDPLHYQPELYYNIAREISGYIDTRGSKK